MDAHFSPFHILIRTASSLLNESVVIASSKARVAGCTRITASFQVLRKGSMTTFCFFVSLLKNASCLLLKICGELCFSSARHLRILANKGLAWELIDWSSICKSCCPRSPALKICIRLHVRWQGRTDQTSLCLSRADSWMDETWRNNVSHVTSEAWVL